MLTFYFYIIFKLKFHEKTCIFTPLTAVINGGNTVFYLRKEILGDTEYTLVVEGLVWRQRAVAPLRRPLGSNRCPSISSLPIVHDPQPDLPNQTRSSISRPRVFLGDGRNSFITFLPLCHMVIAWQYPLLPEIQILPLLFYTSHFLPGGIHRNRTIKILCEVQIIG